MRVSAHMYECIIFISNKRFQHIIRSWNKVRDQSTSSVITLAKLSKEQGKIQISTPLSLL